MSVADRVIKQIIHPSWYFIQPGSEEPPKKFAPLWWAREWLDNIKVDNIKLAHRLCKLIPPQCPFERKIALFGHTILSIPPLCKLNPLYEELVYLRFRALCYLADECGEDIGKYC